MAHFQNLYGEVEQTHGYDDPNRRTDEYGNPVRYTGTTGGCGTGGFDSTTTTGLQGHGGVPAAGTGIGGAYQGNRVHHRSGSSSSSSSEDDGQGERRKKKGLKEKIKEKLPRVGHKDGRSHSQTSATTTPGGYNISGEGQHQRDEKKGMMDKIKEKLPGHHQY